MNLLPRFLEYIKQLDLFHKNDLIVLAVSGGVDSMVLCHLCAGAGFSFVIAQCNFQLRGEESDADEMLVKQLAEKLSVPFYVKKFNTKLYKEQHKLGIQEAARDLRYNWFSELVSELKKNDEAHNVYLLTAHHANDNAETVLYNFLRGTGVKGLTGIPAKRDFIRRPLLFATKKELLDYAGQNNIEYREDASNQSDDYSRNFLRNTLIPQAEKLFPELLQNLNDTAEKFKEIKVLYDERIAEKIKKLAEIKGQEMHIPVLKLQKITAAKTVLHEMLQPLGFTPGQEKEVWKLLDSESGKYILSSTHRILKNRNWLIVSPLQNEAQEILLIEKKDDHISFPGGEIIVKEKKSPVDVSSDQSTVHLDGKEITFPLLLRRWKKGDYFYPLGMQKKKKLSRFFIDQKLSLLQKESCYILESDKKILWVIGYRIDDRFKIKPTTTNALEIKCLPAK